MSFRLTGVLLGVLILLFGAFWYLERARTPTPTPIQATAVFATAAEEVRRLEVSQQGRRTVVERGEAGWRMLEPEAGEADQRRVDDAVGRLTRLTASRTLENQADLGQFGLAQPTTQVAIASKDGATSRLALGDRTPDGASVYARRDDGPNVYVIPSSTASDLGRLVADPPKPRPTATPLPAPVTPIGGVSPLPTPPTLTPAP